MSKFLTISWTILWGFLGVYVFMPALSITLTGGVLWYVGLYLIVLGLCLYSDDDYEYNLSTGGIISLVTGIIIVLVPIVVSLSGWSALGKQAYTYRDLLGKVDTTDFSAHVQPIPADQMVIVDEENARRIGEKELGNVAGLGSRVTVGSFHRMPINGQLYWIAPLEHSGFWKWWRFGNQGTPGYIQVSATNKEDYKLVLLGEGKGIVYQPGGYFGQDLERHIYLNGYMTQGFTDEIFEIDDNNQAWWVVTLYDTKVSYGGADATGVLIVNPTTGAITPYSIAAAPAWVDRIQPISFIKTQVDDWGEYALGWWEAFYGNKVLRASDEYSIVMSHDHNSYYYIGLQSKGDEKSTSGFMMINTRTKEAHWFQQAGATESAAGKSALDEVKEKNYRRSEGICYNIDGHATYEFLLLGDAGLTKMIALVNVGNHGIVGVGEDRQQARYAYQSALHSMGNTVSYSGNDSQGQVMLDRVLRIGSSVSSGQSIYYLIVAGRPTIGFFGNGSLSTTLALTQPGDSVAVAFAEGSNNMAPMTFFTNLSLEVQVDSTEFNKQIQLMQNRDMKRLEKSQVSK